MRRWTLVVATTIAFGPLALAADQKDEVSSIPSVGTCAEAGFRHDTTNLDSIVPPSGGQRAGRTIYAYDNLAEVNRGGVGDALITFDSLAPLVVTELGRSGVAGTLMGGLDFTPDGKLWSFRQTTAGGLYSVNKLNGQATFIGAGGLSGGYFITDLAYNPADGKMYGLGILSTSAPTRIYEISLVTGFATLVKTLDASSNGFLEVGLSCSSAGTLYDMDLVNNNEYRIVGTAPVLDHAIGFDANFSQGTTIDWSTLAPNQGYHGALNNTTFRTELWRFTPGGPSVFVGNIGGINGGTGLPEYETGDVAVEPAVACIPCDTNCDGSINGFDIDPLVDLLTGGGTPCSPCAGDVNGDGSVNGFDVDGFVAALSGGSC
ncbi:MAG: hypothetical protein CHACPFDD_03446 [Phycisphaerae bacterium]|nr:hypothetical protein [Phycisphaerae bacterium]